MHGSRTILSAVCLSIFFGCEPVLAAEQENKDSAAKDNGIIIVTAQRRSESIQTVPLSIFAESGDNLREKGLDNIEALSSSVPNVSFGRNSGDARIFVRGIGYDNVAPGGEPRVALYYDGMYRSKPQSIFDGFFDIERVEILRGPQGTLYGRNATAGAVNIITRDPTSQPEANISVRAGSYWLKTAEAAVSGPLSDNAAARIAVYATDRKGFGENIDTGEDYNDDRVIAGRAKLQVDLGDVELKLAGDYSRRDDHGGGYRYIGAGKDGVVPSSQAFGFQAPSDLQDNAGVGTDRFVESYGGLIEANWSVTEQLSVVSLSGLRRLESDLLTTGDGTSSNLTAQILAEKSTSASEEIRFQYSGTKIEMVAGAYYFYEKNSALNWVPLAGVLFGVPDTSLYDAYRSFGTVKTNAIAVFADGSLELTPTVSLGVGLRWSQEKKDLDEALQFDTTRLFSRTNPIMPMGTQTQSIKESSFDPRIVLSYSPTEDQYYYVSYSKGFKSGGFNIGGLQPPFGPEKISSYEVGFKISLLDGLGHLNISAFRYEYDNLQVNVIEGLGLRLNHSQKATAAARLTADKKFLASLS